MIARGTAGGREPVGLLFAIDMVVHLRLRKMLVYVPGVAYTYLVRVKKSIRRKIKMKILVPGTILWSAG